MKTFLWGQKHIHMTIIWPFLMLPLRQVALQKLFTFATSSIFETCVSGRMVADMCRAAVKVCVCLLGSYIYLIFPFNYNADLWFIVHNTEYFHVKQDFRLHAHFLFYLFFHHLPIFCMHLFVTKCINVFALCVCMLSARVCVCVCLQCHPAESLRLFVPHCCGVISHITDSQYHTVYM